MKKTNPHNHPHKASQIHEHDPNDPVSIPIDGVLDLHTFSPRDLKSLIPAYIDECQSVGILELRMIHGKGTGSLRESTHALLRKNPAVAAFRSAPENAGAWGATLVSLHPPTSPL